MYHTIIIGAGPVGSHLAYRMAQLGYKVIVLDKKAAVGRDICCSGIIGRECLDFFGIDKNLVLRKTSSAKFFSPSGEMLRLWRAEDVACITNRPALDVMLADRAQEAGVEYLLGAQVIDIQVDADRVGVKVDCCGQSRLFEAETAVIATGFGSLLPEKLGLGRIGEYLLGIQAEVCIRDIDEVEIYFDQSLAPGGFGWLVPTIDGRGLVGLLGRSQPHVHIEKLLSHLRAQGKIDSAEVAPCYGVIPLRPLSRTYVRRVVVVGEAAGQVKPTTGGGIYYGLLCADIAADNLNKAFLASDFSIDSLSLYDKQWRAMLGRELRIEYWARRLYARLSNHRIERLFHLAANNNIPGLVNELDKFSFDWHGGLIFKVLKHLAISVPLSVIKKP